MLRKSLSVLLAWPRAENENIKNILFTQKLILASKSIFNSLELFFGYASELAC